MRARREASGTVWIDMGPGVVAAVVLLAGCASRMPRVAVADLWDYEARDRVVETSGVLELGAGSDCDDAILRDGEATAELELPESACSLARSLAGRRVVVAAYVSIGSAMMDVNLAPDAAGCKPFLSVHVRRLRAAGR